MPETIAYASNTPKPAAWCLRCGRKYDKIPPGRRCSDCSAALRTPRGSSHGIVVTTSGVLVVSLLSIIGPVTLTFAVKYPPLVVLEMAWANLLRFLIPIAYLVLLFHARWALSSDARSLLGLGIMVFSLAFIATGFAPEILGMQSSAYVLEGLCEGLLGVALLQLGLWLMLSSSNCGHWLQQREFTLIGIALAIGQLAFCAGIVAWPGQPRLPVVGLVALPMAAQIVLLCVVWIRLR